MIKKDVAGRMFASWGKTRNSQYGAIAGLTVMLAICIYAALVKFQPHPISGEDPETARVITTYIGAGVFFAICRILFNLYIDLPYLQFTEDQFYVADENDNKLGGYWRDVVEIIDGKVVDDKGALPDKAVGLVLADGRLFVIDPSRINLRGDDVAGIAKEFWQTALAKIS